MIEKTRSFPNNTCVVCAPDHSQRVSLAVSPSSVASMLVAEAASSSSGPRELLAPVSISSGFARLLAEYDDPQGLTHTAHSPLPLLPSVPTDAH